MHFLVSENWICNKDAFTCQKGNPKCISPEQTCNEFDDCSDGSDENSELCGLFLMLYHIFTHPEFQIIIEFQTVACMWLFNATVDVMGIHG